MIVLKVLCALPFLILILGTLIDIFTEGPRPEWYDDPF